MCNIFRVVELVSMASGGKHHNIRKIEKVLDNIRKEPPVLVPKYDEIFISSDSKGRY